MKDAEYVKSILPHRDPFLLVDGIIEENSESLKAFRELLPENPIYPGVLIIEGLAQAAGLLLLKDSSSIPLFLGIERARFKREVRPGDRLVYSVRIVGQRHGIATVKGEAAVNDEVVAVADLMVSTKRQ